MTRSSLPSSRGPQPGPVLRRLGCQDYVPVFHAMQAFNSGRDARTADEIWVLEHAPVYTLGLGARAEHVHATGTIPVVHTDRGGQVTYHGPGQLVVYLLLDLRRAGIGIRDLVRSMEQATIDLLAGGGVTAGRRPGAPGVYVDERKIAALGVRVRRGACYHGLSLNVDMDLGPFAAIDPCGYPGLAVTQLRDIGIPWTTGQAAGQLLPHLCRALCMPAPMEFADSPGYPFSTATTQPSEQPIGN